MDTTYAGQSAPLQEDISSPLLNPWSNWQQSTPSTILQDSVSTPRGYQQAATGFTFASMPTLGPQPSMINIPNTEVKSDSPPESTQLMDMGMMVSGESGMDEHWISFMRGSGLLEPNAYSPPSQANTSNNMDPAFTGKGAPHVAFR